MLNRIEILPEAVANQIAAGEVVQRPASMVKELMENAVDAGAHTVNVVVRDGGKSLVQVMDDGSGIPAEDAVRAFERHATSKIRQSKDLFSLHTFGFRGEALASIAAVAEVTLTTRRAEDEVGIQVAINGGTAAQARTQSVSCPQGTQITVRNLFFNTPARRKFLKSDATETKQILAEFQRVALCHPDCFFSLTADDRTLLNLAPSSLHQRIAALVGRRLGDQLLPVEVDTPIVRIGGYVGLPDSAKKGSGEQFFFVNGRYFRSSYLQKAVANGYNKLLPPGYIPSYFIYIDVDPTRIDVNIHPQKTEIKFEDEQAMFQIVASAVARSLGKHNVVPMLDFDNPAVGLEIPSYRENRSAAEPPAATNAHYNPFRSYDRQEWSASARVASGVRSAAATIDPERIPFTEMIPPGLMMDAPAPPVFAMGEYHESALGSDADPNDPSSGGYQALQQQLDIELPVSPSAKSLSLAGGRYVLTTTADGAVVIDCLRAQQRITYERLLVRIDAAGEAGGGVGQRELFPETIELSPADHFLLLQHAGELAAMGFDLRDMGGSTVVVYGLPAEMGAGVSPTEAVEELLQQLRHEGASLRDNHRERLAAALSRSCSAGTPAPLTPLESDALVRQLFACDEPNYTPDGKPVMTIFPLHEIEKRLKK